MSSEWVLFVDADPGAAPWSVINAIRRAADADSGSENDGAAQEESTNSPGRRRRFRHWRVRPSSALASEHNAELLKAALDVESLDEVYLFAVSRPAADNGNGNGNGDATAATYHTFLDPSATPIDLMLHDGALVLATADPYTYLAGQLRALPRFPSALFRFTTRGDALEASGVAARKVVRVQGSAWAGGVAIANMPFDSERGISSVTFRISQTRFRSDVAPPAVDADGLRVPPAVGDELPIVAIGLCDETCEAEGDATAFGKHNKSWLLNVVSGALQAGQRATFVDGYHFTPGPSVTITMTMDTDKGTVFLAQNGKHIGGFTVSRYLAEGMYPCVELYSRGATVELL